MPTNDELLTELESRCRDLIALIRGYISTDDEFDTRELLLRARLLDEYNCAINNILLNDDNELASDLLADTTLGHLTNKT